MFQVDLLGIPTRGTPSNTVSEIWLSGGNGYGSLGTAIRRYTTILRQTGKDIEYRDDAVNGASFKVKTKGLYAIFLSDNRSGATDTIGLTCNQPDLTVQVSNLDPPINLGYANNDVGFVITVTVIGYFYEGDVIRANGNANSTAAKDTSFRMIKIGV